ncbi:leucine rich adaptor protein 1-like [Synchiropus splendidus]|uniref:leucine rich adaptor protein 1-like n=1 Tax=Synchiropus splendidus TaxID=270530 RepID=UPI00237D4E16|nr:leucine rich adaptor protein 1-like [Synchiropus splendidus]
MEESRPALPGLNDLESKLGRKVPESLIRSLVGHEHEEERNVALHPVTCTLKSADVKRLESKIQFLKQEMAHLRAIDVKVMQQLLSVNEGIESFRWLMEEREGMVTTDGSLTGSLYSLSDSQEGTSLGSSFNSLNDASSDGLDGLSVGSYLDTLAEGLPDNTSPVDCYLEKTVIDGDAFNKTPLKVHVESDEYYCFG